MKDESRNVVTTPTQIGSLVTGHLQHALSTEAETPNPTFDDLLLETLHNTITQEDNDTILGVFTLEEVSTMVFNMGTYKALGPDGFPSAFFQIF